MLQFGNGKTRAGTKCPTFPQVYNKTNVKHEHTFDSKELKMAIIMRTKRAYAIYTLQSNGKRLFHGIVTCGVADKFVRDNPGVDRMILDMTTGDEWTYNAR
jgi:hypothetical protein